MVGNVPLPVSSFHPMRNRQGWSPCTMTSPVVMDFPATSRGREGEVASSPKPILPHKNPHISPHSNPGSNVRGRSANRLTDKHFGCYTSSKRPFTYMYFLDMLRQ